jgi:hypothetical protein
MLRALLTSYSRSSTSAVGSPLLLRAMQRYAANTNTDTQSLIKVSNVNVGEVTNSKLPVLIEFTNGYSIARTLLTKPQNPTPTQTLNLKLQHDTHHHHHHRHLATATWPPALECNCLHCIQFDFDTSQWVLVFDLRID